MKSLAVMHQHSTVPPKMTLVLSTAAVIMETNAVKKEKVASLKMICVVLMVRKNAIASSVCRPF